MFALLGLFSYLNQVRPLCSSHLFDSPWRQDWFLHRRCQTLDRWYQRAQTYASSRRSACSRPHLRWGLEAGTKELHHPSDSAHCFPHETNWALQGNQPQWRHLGQVGLRKDPRASWGQGAVGAHRIRTDWRWRSYVSPCCSWNSGRNLVNWTNPTGSNIWFLGFSRLSKDMDRQVQKRLNAIMQLLFFSLISVELDWCLETWHSCVHKIENLEQNVVQNTTKNFTAIVIVLEFLKIEEVTNVYVRFSET